MRKLVRQEQTANRQRDEETKRQTDGQTESTLLTLPWLSSR